MSSGHKQVDRDCPYFYHLRGQRVVTQNGDKKVVTYKKVTPDDLQRFVEYVRQRKTRLGNGEMVRLFSNFKIQLMATPQDGGTGIVSKLIREINRDKLWGATFAFDHDGRWHYAICVDPDNFSKKKGRWIAGGRLRKHGPVV